ncbi:MAG: hypothetical protein ACRDS0_29905 [Pseudonocardiaceae bacterium]
MDRPKGQHTGRGQTPMNPGRIQPGETSRADGAVTDVIPPGWTTPEPPPSLRDPHPAR